MIVDAHVHMGIPYRPAFGNSVSYTAEDLLLDMDRADVDVSLIMGIPHVYDNDYVIESARRFPDRFIPWAYIDPWHHPEPRDSIARIADRGFAGIKFRSVSLRYNLADHRLLDPFFEACGASGLLVSMHTGDDPSATPLQVEEMAKAFPDQTIIMIHAGFRTLASEAIRVASRCPNVYLDETAGHSLQLKRALDAIGPERIIYGSDAPYMDTRVEQMRFRVAVDDADARDLMMARNILRLTAR